MSTSVITLPAVQAFIDMHIAEFEPQPFSRSAHETANDLGYHVLESMEGALNDRDPTRTEKDSFGLGILSTLPVRCAEVFRGDSIDDFLQAFSDSRTFEHTLKLFARDKSNLTLQTENAYGLPFEYMTRGVIYKPLLHVEQDGAFFSLHLDDIDRLRREGVRGNCPYVGLMHDTTIAFAHKLADLGVVEKLLAEQV